MKVWEGNVGKSGHTTQNHVHTMDKFLLQLTGLDAVILLVGVNDMPFRLSRGKMWRHPGLSRKKVRQTGK